MRELTIATYNVHQWFGTDGQRDFDRGVRVIRDLNADIVGLQEFTVPHHGGIPLMEEHLAVSTGMRVVFGPTMLRGDTSFGNVLLHRHDVLEFRRHNLPEARREPRGAIDAILRVEDKRLRVVTTHLGVKVCERKRQVRHLLEILGNPCTGLVCLMGDFNNWLPCDCLLSGLNRWFGGGRCTRTFPAPLPFLPLDRIWVRPRERLVSIQVHRSGSARIASDHLPLKATVRLL
jgi:endonuclease/exonuclease/phosphatase family metal-dependent hydrolase